MTRFKEKYVVDEDGNRVSVLLDIADFEKILDDLEELESIRSYDKAKASGDEAIPLEQAASEIEEGRSRGKPIRYVEPFGSVAEENWDALR